MLFFPDTFFQEEMRYEFRITETMKRAWAAQMEVLAIIMQVCGLHGIHYYAFWGTLLGAVRHAGFIPWDDDIDICMRREDYNRFLEVIGNELPKSYCVLNVYNEPEYKNTFTRVTNSHSINLNKEHMEVYHGCPFVVGIDIFPLDYVPDNEELARYQREHLDMVRDLLALAEYMEENSDQSANQETAEAVAEIQGILEEGITALESNLGFTIDHARPYKNQLRQCFDKICMLYGTADASRITSYPEYAAGRGILLPKEWFGDTQMKFENMEIAVPTEYDKVLTALYGDYMQFVRGGADHEYPFYKDQLNMLHERGLWNDIEG